ncbi:MAG: hypothetical protein APF78_02095 [Sphingomonadales bacterium BRH_c3]|nr:MAG: hypothetical protein APF78_02095 [Sphingomonadales bacterium BRH_c3]
MNDTPSLAERQAAFMAQVLFDEAPLPQGWNDRHAAGIEVYRGNYRSSLIEALKSTYEKTERWVGEDAFRRAAAHHVITNPPTSWTLDDAGAGFDATCAELFRNDPEVAELAWLEWAMFQAFTSADVASLDADGFTWQTSGFGEEEWTNLRLEFLPGAASRQVSHNMRAIWNALGEDELVHVATALDTPQSVLVWREGERATFMMGSVEEARAFAALQGGMPYGEMCMMLAGEEATADEAQQAAMRAGALLGRWLNEGLIAALRT